MQATDPNQMLPGKKYFIKTLLAHTIPLNGIVRFKTYVTNRSTWVSGDPPEGRRFAVFVIPASSRGSAYDWSVNMEDLRESYIVVGSCPQQRDAQLGLLGTLPIGQSLPYDLGRLIASYV
jgi:hypothetical protein